MSRFGNKMGSDERDSSAVPKSQGNGGESSGGPGFGRRRERPDADLLPVVNTGSGGASQRTPRSVSPPID